MSEWTEISIGKYCKVQGGFAFKSNDFIEKGVPVAKIKNVKERDIDLTDCGFVNENLANSNSDYFVKKGDVLISMTGSGMNAPNSIVGRVARHIGSDNAFLINQRVGRFLIKDETQLDKHFLFHYLSPKERQLELVSIATGSANQVNISGKQIETLKINLPSLHEQKAIAHILGSLDNKIELNRQMNQTLEAMAQALFKSWFVDFDPVMDNALAAGQEIPDELLAMAEKRHVIASGAKQSASKRLIDTNPELAALFPSSFVFNETLGKWIPEGWEVKSFSEFVDAKQGKYLPRNEMSENINETHKYQVWGGNGIRGYSNKSMYKDSVIVLTCRGSNCGLLNLTNSASWISNIGFACESKIGSVFFAFQALSTTLFDDTISGSAQPQITYSALKSKIIPIAVSNELAKEYSKAIDVFYNRIFKNENASENLIQLRDYLLPELISGRVRVKESIIRQ